MAIGDEQDPRNMHLLLHGLHVIIKDIATYESAVGCLDGQHSESDPSPCDANPNLTSADEGV